MKEWGKEKGKENKKSAKRSGPSNKFDNLDSLSGGLGTKTHLQACPPQAVADWSVNDGCCV